MKMVQGCVVNGLGGVSVSAARRAMLRPSAPTRSEVHQRHRGGGSAVLPPLAGAERHLCYAVVSVCGPEQLNVYDVTNL